MFNPDRPIKSLNDDLLNRQNLAIYIGNAILGSQIIDSLVIGLLGKWGSGKTSLVNMVIEHIENISTSLESDEMPIIVYFNPWNFSGQNQLISQFFNKLSFTLERPDYSNDLKNVGRLLKTVSKIAKPFRYVPTFSASASVCSDLLDSVAEATKGAGESLEVDLDETKKAISDILEKQNMKMIIVIDDIDRLNNMEIRQVFQLIKSLADFPNTVYLLTFDKKVVIDALEKEQEGYGEEYLEKIVQVPLEIPLISKGEIEKLLTTQLDILIGGIPESEFDRVHWGNVYQSGFKYFFENVRDITRYINVLRFSYELVKDEVNVIDFIAITAVQVFIPDVYQKIRENKEIFTGLSTIGRRANPPEYKQICDDMIGSNDQKVQAFLLNYLEILFPNLKSIYRSISYGGDFEKSWRVNRRICSADFFDVYFKFSLPNGEISQGEIKSIISSCNDREKFSDKLLELREHGKILRFLDIFLDHTNKIQKENIGNIVSSIMDIGDLFPDDDSFLWGTPMRIHVLIKSLIKNFDNQNERFAVLKDSIRDDTHSLYTFVYEVDFLDELHGRYLHKKAKTSEEDLVVSAKQLDELEKLVCAKIRSWDKKGLLEGHKKILPILKIWKQWGAEEKDIENVINKIIKSDEKLINFVSNCISPFHSMSINNYVGETKWNISFKAIKEFMDLNIVESRLKEISVSYKFDMATYKEKIAVNLFLTYLDSYRLNPDQKILPSNY